MHPVPGSFDQDDSGGLTAQEADVPLGIKVSQVCRDFRGGFWFRAFVTFGSLQEFGATEQCFFKKPS